MPATDTPATTSGRGATIVAGEGGGSGVTMPEVFYAIIKHDSAYARRVYAGYLTGDLEEAKRICEVADADHPGLFRVAKLTYVDAEEAK